MKKCTLLFVVTFLLSCYLIAKENQEAPKIKFEKVSMEELAMKTYANDTTAEAVILYDDGSSYIKYEVGNGFNLTYERFVRIKILKQSGVEWGNFSILLYSHEKDQEKINQLKGTTFNLENGKVVKTDLKKESIFQERQNKYYETVRLSMPSIKVGSVIDLKYSVTTNLIWNLRTWKFQYTIPVRWSQYSIIYPEYYIYNQTFMGYHGLLYNKSGHKNETINYTVRGERDPYKNSGTRLASNQTISYINETFDLAAKDVPAVKTEPYLTTIDNYITQVKLELASTNFTFIGGTFKNYTTSWNDIAKQLKDDDNFGTQLKTDGFIEDAVLELIKGTSDEQKKLSLLYNYVQHIMKWDGHKSVFTDKTLKKAYSDKTGSSADINLLLTVMLNKAGINAYPVVLSTRENGILTHATISDCNYVIVQAIVKGKSILLDATEPNLQAGFIPYRCLNGEGHLINNEESQPVQLSNPKSVENTMVELEMNGGKIKGMINYRSTGLGAFNLRESIKSSGGKKEYFLKIKNGSSELEYLDYQYYNLDSLNLPVKFEYKIAMKEGQEGDAAIIYIDPILIGRQKDNPFTSPMREYPVDFGELFNETYSLQLKIPEGYTVEELPKNISMAMEGKAGQFQYQITQVDNKILLNYRLSLDKVIFVPSEYQALKNFYNLVINKQAEQIILKKIII